MFVAVFLVCMSACAFAAKQADLDPEDFAIMPWGGSPGDAKTLRDIKDCGFNLAGFLVPNDVKVAKKVGLKCLVIDQATLDVNQPNLSDAEVIARVKKLTSQFRSDPTVFGYYVKDEPGMGEYANLARWNNAILKEDPKAFVYINLLPQFTWGNYDEYVGKFISTVKPTYLSYDLYALYDDGSVKPTLYTNLEIMRKKSLEHNIPFMNIVLGNCHFHYAKPSVEGLSLQVYATLAYGGRGISYFTYFCPPAGNYRMAAIDQFGHKTPTWDMIRFVNLQIHKLAPTYTKLKSVNVFHYPNVPDSCKGIDTSKYVKEVKGGDFLVGEFESPDGRPYVMLVNKDINKSANFSIIFKWPGKVMMVNQYTGTEYPAGGEHDWLAPGQGVLLSLIKDTDQK